MEMSIIIIALRYVGFLFVSKILGGISKNFEEGEREHTAVNAVVIEQHLRLPRRGWPFVLLHGIGSQF